MPIQSPNFDRHFFYVKIMKNNRFLILPGDNQEGLPKYRYRANICEQKQAMSNSI